MKIIGWLVGTSIHDPGDIILSLLSILDFRVLTRIKRCHIENEDRICSAKNMSYFGFWKSLL